MLKTEKSQSRKEYLLKKQDEKFSGIEAVGKSKLQSDFSGADDSSIYTRLALKTVFRIFQQNLEKAVWVKKAIPLPCLLCTEKAGGDSTVLSCLAFSVQRQVYKLPKVKTMPSA